MAIPDRFDAEEARAYDERAPRSLPGYAALFRGVAERLLPGAPMVFADFAVTSAPGSEAAQVRRRVAIGHGWSAADASMMVKYMFEQLHPVDGADLGRLLAECGFGPAEPFFQALGYRAWFTHRASHQ